MCVVVIRCNLLEIIPFKADSLSLAKVKLHIVSRKQSWIHSDFYLPYLAAYCLRCSSKGLNMASTVRESQRNKHRHLFAEIKTLNHMFSVSPCSHIHRKTFNYRYFNQVLLQDMQGCSALVVEGKRWHLFRPSVPVIQCDTIWACEWSSSMEFSHHS